MALAKTYKELIVWQKAFRFSVEIHHESLKWPQHEQMRGIADQIRRASKSICANIAEGMGKQGSKTEFNRFLGLALGSATEVMVWLDYAEQFSYSPVERVAEWRAGMEEVARMLRGLRTSLKVAEA